MKKTFTRFLLVAVATVLLLSLCAFAEGAKYVIDTNKGYAGDSVNVDIYLESSHGFGGLAYEVVYDNELLSVVQYEKKLGANICVDSGNKLKDKIVFQYAGLNNIEGNAPLVTITFKIGKNATAKKAKISVIGMENSCFYYGGENKRTEFMFDTESAEGFIEILSDDNTTIQNNGPVGQYPVISEPVTDKDQPDEKEALDDGESVNEQNGWTNPFTDVNEGDWYFEAVKNASIKGIINGVTSTEFAPNQKLTRAMFVTMLFRLEVLPRVRMHNFSDVPFGAWYYNPVAWASEEGIVKGITPTEFVPNISVTREQLATMLFRYAIYKGMDAVTMEENLESFEDSHDISEYAVSALNWAVGKGIINGTSSSRISPKDSATRAQVAVILDRYLQLMNQ